MCFLNGEVKDQWTVIKCFSFEVCCLLFAVCCLLFAVCCDALYLSLTRLRFSALLSFLRVILRYTQDVVYSI